MVASSFTLAPCGKGREERRSGGEKEGRLGPPAGHGVFLGTVSLVCRGSPPSSYRRKGEVSLSVLRKGRDGLTDARAEVRSEK